jgi:formylglycine-generating enzyme required for sulfatase activity
MPSLYTFGNKFSFKNGGLVVRNDLILTANSAAIGSTAVWNGGLNFTTVGTNGRTSYYGTYDQTGLLWEWCDANAANLTFKVIRGGDIAGGGLAVASFNNASAAFAADGYDTNKTRRYLKTVAGGDVNAPIFVSNRNYARGKPQDKDWGGRIATVDNPLSLNNFVTVGDSGNSADTTGFGAVSYEYKIGKYLITNEEYCSFLNAVAITDTYGLYSTQMSSERVGGITRSGSSGSYSYAVKANYAHKPVYFISWFGLARYCNWLHNSYGSTETGAYTLNGASTGIINKNAGAKYYIPTENEWYKAAYYKGGGTNKGYWRFATQSDKTPTPVNASPIGNGTVNYTTIKPETNTGSNVAINKVEDTAFGIGIDINYEQVNNSGRTNITPITQKNPTLPANFTISNTLAKYNISTTSSRSGNIDLCFTLPSNISQATFNNTRIFHTNSAGITTDSTILTGPNAPNYSLRKICARTTNFSDFYMVPSMDIVSGQAIPYNLSGYTSNGAVNLSWSMDTTTDIYDYSIKYSSDNGDSWQDYAHSQSSDLSITISPLTNNTAYIFKVASISASGYSDLSSSSSSFTPTASLPSVPLNVSGISKINSVDLSWEVPSDNGGSPITNYTVQYSSDSGSSWTSSNDPLYLFADDVSTTRNLTVTNLSAIPYIFRVAAVNSIGTSDYSSSSNSVTPTSSSSPDCDLVITEGDFTIQNIIQTHNNDNLITHTGSYIITRS